MGITIEDTCKQIDVDDVMKYDYHLSQDVIIKGQTTYKGQHDRYGKNWSCGPNSA